MVPTHIPPIPAVTGHDDSELELEELSFSGRHFGHFLPTSRGGEERKVVILGLFRKLPITRGLPGGRWCAEVDDRFV